MVRPNTHLPRNITRQVDIRALSLGHPRELLLQAQHVHEEKIQMYLR